ncbi:MAG: zf-HC2 domain-containing protein [Anaerolineae bacterium]|nr:zf-HC2 domain-containing protein [Anaerolineae bacterium]
MSENHVTHQLEAYYDGVLSPAQRARVEAHLATCNACRAELQALQSLSTLLHTAPPAETVLSPERFVAQVGLRLPRRQELSPAQRVLEAAWRLVPVGLLGAWTFLQTLFVVGTVALVARWIFGDFPGLSAAPSTALWMREFLHFSGANLRDLLPLAAETWWNSGALHPVQTWGFILILGLSIGYSSWLVSWWIRQPKNHAMENRAR